MTNEPYYPVGISDAEAALLRQAREYRGSDVLDSDVPGEEAVSSAPVAQQAWEQVRTKLRRKVLGVAQSQQKKSRKSTKKTKKAPKVKFVRGGALATAIFSLMLMPMFGVLAPVVAIAVTGRAILIGRLRGVFLVAMVLVQALSWALLFNAA